MGKIALSIVFPLALKISTWKFQLLSIMDSHNLHVFILIFTAQHLILHTCC